MARGAGRRDGINKAIRLCASVAAIGKFCRTSRAIVDYSGLPLLGGQNVLFLYNSRFTSPDESAINKIAVSRVLYQRSRDTDAPDLT